MIKGIKFLIKTAIVLIILALLILGYARFIEPYNLECTEAEIDSPLISADGEPIKAALFGDTHFGFNYDIEDFEKVIAEIEKASPDIIFFTGDLVDNLNTYKGDFAEISEALSRLEAPLGKFAVYGNHDYSKHGNNIYEDIMTTGGFKVLINESAELTDYNTVIHGIDDCLIGYGDPTFLQYADESKFNLVLCHEPDVFAEILDYNVSLMLSGHTHGGQIKLPVYVEPISTIFLPPYGRQYVSGMYEESGSVLYVTHGIGTTKLPLRFMAVPELAFISIY